MTKVLTETLGTSAATSEEVAARYPKRYFEKKDLLLLKITTLRYGTKLQIKWLYKVHNELLMELEEWETPGGLATQSRIYFVELPGKVKPVTKANLITNRLNSSDVLIKPLKIY